MKHIFDVETQSETVIELTKDDLAQIKKMQDAEAIFQAEAQTRATARQVILDRLGLTAEEAALLLG